MATLINGNGNNAVYAQQDADLYAGALGESTRILNVGSKLAYTIEDANTIAVADGVILTKEGRRIQVDVGSVDEFTIPTGAAGVTRYYIIGYHLYTDGSANQKCETFVQLMASESETIPEAEFREGATEVYVSLYRIKQIGLNLDTITALLSVGIALTDMTDVIGDTDISGIGDGTLTGGLNAVNQNLTEKIDTFSGTVEDEEHTTYSAITADGIAYDATNEQLLLKVNGADTVIPFKSKHLVGQVPKMTSNTAPYGEAFASSTLRSGYEAYRAFDNPSDGKWWASVANQATNAYLGYKFNEPVCVKRFSYIQKYASSTSLIDTTISLEYSNDGTNWITIPQTYQLLSTRNSYTEDVDNTVSALYWRIKFAGGNNNGQGGYFALMSSLQFYAWQQLPTVIDYPIG